MLLSYTFLKQGKWKTDNSFFSKYYFEDGHLFSIAIFHQSIALVARLQEPNASPSAWEKWQYVMVPKPGIGIDVIQ